MPGQLRARGDGFAFAAGLELSDQRVPRLEFGCLTPNRDPLLGDDQRESGELLVHRIPAQVAAPAAPSTVQRYRVVFAPDGSVRI